jgi:enoyl-[acyl-carrier protein] reductase/trans-2-enoyl-CoA reductase (NAD+)
VKEIWPRVTSGNLREITDFNNYQEEFLKLFGFGLPGVDYDQEVDPMVGLDD